MHETPVCIGTQNTDYNENKIPPRYSKLGRGIPLRRCVGGLRRPCLIRPKTLRVTGYSPRHYRYVPANVAGGYLTLRTERIPSRVDTCALPGIDPVTTVMYMPMSQAGMKRYERGEYLVRLERTLPTPPKD